MKTFKSVRNVSDIIDDVQRLGYPHDFRGYNDGSDYIHFGTPIPDEETGVQFGFTHLNTFNGTFYVCDERGSVVATERSEELDDKQWYKDLLELIYIADK